MGFNLTVTRSVKNKKQVTEWVYHPPKADSEKRNRAALIRLVHKKDPSFNRQVWVDDRKPVGIQTGKGESFQFLLGAKILQLPFEIELENFKMATNPGTMDPASYESFVKVKSGDSTSQEHVFMNNPLKKEGFTFYQASYFQLEKGQGYGSIFSVNRDPGRLIKYLGSLLLVSGATIHFAIRSRRKKRTAV